jgi:16S rRNA (uracil1498-N3)-methyltransferase
VPAAHEAGVDLDLPPEEGQHAARVLRVREGQAVRVFDGAGHEFDAVVTGVRSGAVRVRLLGAVAPPAAEPGVRVTLVQAVLKGEGMDGVVRDAVMLGVTTVVPLFTMRTEVSPGVVAKGHRRERWARIAVSSAKQCGRAVVPTVAEPLSLAALLDGVSGVAPLMLVEPSVVAVGVTGMSALRGARPAAATLVVGPEGGWAPEEVAAASPVCRLVRLGGRTLRADATALVALSALLAGWDEL